jgi:hypothetical protein
VQRNNEAAEEAHFVTRDGIWHERREADHAVEHHHDDNLVNELNLSSAFTFERLHPAN